MDHLYAPWRQGYFDENGEKCAQKNSRKTPQNSHNTRNSQTSQGSLKNSQKLTHEKASKKNSQNLPHDKDCIFCQIALNPQNDTLSRVIFRAKCCYGVMNRYPYSPGHFMVLPYEHQECIQSLPEHTWSEMSFFVREGVGILKKALKARGVNIGMNLGEQAGAGIAAHCHYHLVPRWFGDTNFITTIGDTRVCGRDLDEIYAVLSAEFRRFAYA